MIALQRARVRAEARHENFAFWLDFIGWCRNHEGSFLRSYRPVKIFLKNFSGHGRRGRVSREKISLRELRESQGLTLEQLETLSGVSLGHISAVELGTAKMTDEVLMKLAKALKKSPGEIIVPWMPGQPRPGTIPAQEGDASVLRDEAPKERQIISLEMYQKQTRRMERQMEWLARHLSDEQLKSAQLDLLDEQVLDWQEKEKLHGVLHREQEERRKKSAGKN